MPVDDAAETMPAAGGLMHRLSRAPCLAAPEAARARLDDWLDEQSGAAVALRRALDEAPAARAVIEGIADGSPYLWDLICADPQRLARLLAADPDAHIAALITTTGQAVTAAADAAEAARLLRRMKVEAALLIALCDIGGVWEVMRVTKALTDIADAAVASAVRYLLASAAHSGHLRPADPERPEEGSGYIILAMGKMGAFELNYSSDIDLIVFFDPTAPALPPDAEPGALFVRLTRRLIKLLQERTVDGYVFRVDVRLRPDPSSTQIAVSVPAALHYYESVGQNWERAAMIKARPCAGDLEAGDAVLRNLAPFVWRRYLDFAAVADVQAMKRQIHAYRGHGDIAIEGHNIKLGRGGIREIEFFAQTQQLIAGGRNPRLRERETLATLAALTEENWITESVRAELETAYRFLREVEHRLQMVADEQTHSLPGDRAGLERFARFLGYSGRDSFAAALVAQLAIVQSHYAALFENAANHDAEQLGLVFTERGDDKETLDKLNVMGFRHPLEASAIIRNWLAGTPRALRGEAARSCIVELVPLLIKQFAAAENPDNALASFDRFLDNLHGGARLLSLLRQNPDLLGLVALVLGVAPRLADTLAQHPQVMDALIDPAFFGALPDDDKLTEGLAVALGQAVNAEEFLDGLRMFGREQMFLIGTRILSGTVSAEQAGEVYARLADVVIRALHRRVGEDFAETYGRISGQNSAVIAMGRLGGREMTATSDLDLILIYDFDAEQPESDGPRQLYGGQYFARLTQRLINAMTVRTNHGRLYDVDMRLRPSGHSGPVATSIDAFALYQRDDAWTWEHLALTRARVVSASPGFAARVETAIRDVLRTERDASAIAGDVVEMRRAIAMEKGESDRWNLKYVAGGLIDLEFIAQYLQLVHAAKLPGILDTSTGRVFEKATRLGVLAIEDADVLRPATRLYQDLIQLIRLCLPGEFNPKTASNALRGLMERAADVPNFATLDAHVAETQLKVRRCFERIVGPME